MLHEHTMLNQIEHSVEIYMSLMAHVKTWRISSQDKLYFIIKITSCLIPQSFNLLPSHISSVRAGCRSVGQGHKIN